MMEEKERFSVIDIYLKMAENKPIFGQLHPGNTWFDLGKPEQIEIVASFLKTHPEFTGKP
jgi:hypothetical protein